LAINPLYMNTWFSLGCAYMRFDEWDKALRAFSRVVSLDPEVRYYCPSWFCFFVSCFSILCCSSMWQQPEAWANMASIYIKQKKKCVWM
jgi:tetratricopeptide (TPR) repeat protein